MEYLNTQSLMLPILTLWVINSQWPTSTFFASLGKYEIYRWFCAFILCYQGQGGQNMTLTAVACLVLYVFNKVVDMFMAKQEGYY
jgi:hypothetical protein